MADTNVETAQPGVHAVTPHLICAGAGDAIEFYKRAFGAEEMIRIPGNEGKLMHACIRINGSTIMLVDENLDWEMRGPKELGGSSVSIHLVVENADASFDRAVEAGATPIMPVEDAFWGDRFGLLEDPFGHRWSVASPLKKVTRDELLAAAKEAANQTGGCGNAKGG